MQADCVRKRVFDFPELDIHLAILSVRTAGKSTLLLSVVVTQVQFRLCTVLFLFQEKGEQCRPASSHKPIAVCCVKVAKRPQHLPDGVPALSWSHPSLKQA